jgi:hypothetical protein
MGALPVEVLDEQGGFLRRAPRARGAHEVARQGQDLRDAQKDKSDLEQHPIPHRPAK